MANKRNHNSTINDGKDSESIFQAWMEKRKFVVIRLRDKRDLHGLNNRSVAAFGQPADFIVVAPGGAFLAEVKSSQEKTSLPLSCFTPSQRSTMARCSANGVGHNYVIYAHNLIENVWYSFNADEIIDTIKSGRKSLRWSDMTYIGEL